jgi:hypothetical protein
MEIGKMVKCMDMVYLNGNCHNMKDITSTEKNMDRENLLFLLEKFMKGVGLMENRMEKEF